MADLNPLIRFRRHIVDEKQKILSQLYREAEKIEQSRQMILDQMEREKQLAAEMGPDAGTYLGRYLDGARRKVHALNASLKKMEIRIDTAREDIRGAFAEMKKVQITQEQREEREAQEEQKKEDRAMDEIGLEQFNKIKDNN